MKKLAIIGIIIFILMQFLHEYDTTPTVYWSYSEDKCVSVLRGDNEYSCATLEPNEVYRKVWVR